MRSIKGLVSNAVSETEPGTDSDDDSSRSSSRLATLAESVVVGEKLPVAQLCSHWGCKKKKNEALQCLPNSKFCVNHKCVFPDCSSGLVSNKLCVSHGGGKRCTFVGCARGAEGSTHRCTGHGGGKRCIHTGCIRKGRGRSALCISHGGGKRCETDGCTKAAQAGNFCKTHGGYRTCKVSGCKKHRKKSGFCLAHFRMLLCKTPKIIEVAPKVTSWPTIKLDSNELQLSDNATKNRLNLVTPRDVVTTNLLQDCLKQQFLNSSSMPPYSLLSSWNANLPGISPMAWMWNPQLNNLKDGSQASPSMLPLMYALNSAIPSGTSSKKPGIIKLYTYK